jgi:hypothetical protein
VNTEIGHVNTEIDHVNTGIGGRERRRERAEGS